MIATKQNGIMRTYSTTEYIETTNNIGYGWLNTGIQKNDKICIFIVFFPFVGTNQYNDC